VRFRLIRAEEVRPPDLESMYQQLVVVWQGVKEIFPQAWGLPPTRSRLMHSAGIQAMGYLKDRLVTRTQGGPDQGKQIRSALRRLRPACAWTEGSWTDLGLAWDEVQSVPRHIRGLLVRLDHESSRSGTG
jgi:hypothetical protein